MSQYQYYEFLAIDCPLTEKQKLQLGDISTRARISSVGFVNEYHWGDLKAEPHDLVRRFFDAHVYLANWGNASLTLKLPRDGIRTELLDAFASSEYLEVVKLPRHWLLTWSVFESEDYDRFGYIEGEGWMAQLAPLREELLSGDYRSLYIGWLAAVSQGEVQIEEMEPMVLSGLSELTAAQQALAEYIEVDEDLLAGAGIGNPSAQLTVIDTAVLDSWLDELPRSEVHGYLRQMLDGQTADAARTLKRHYDAWQNKMAPKSDQSPRSVETLWQLAEEAKNLRLKKLAKARRQAEAARIRQRNAMLSNIAEKFPRAWQSAHEFANKAHAHAYDAACQQLVDIRDAYLLCSNANAFENEFNKFIDTHRKRRALLVRLTRAGLPAFHLAAER